VRWSGSVYAPAAGTYRLGTTAVDESSIDIDGRALVATPRPNVHAEREVELEQGWHAIDVRYRALTDYSQVELLWVRPEGARERVPAAMLRPPGPGGRRRARDAPAPEVPELRRAAEAPAPTGDAAPALAVRATRAIPPGRGRRIAAADDGRVFVLDPASKRVWLVGAKGPPAPVAPAREPWIDPSDLAVAADGRLHVLDAGGFVATYSPRLQPERTLDLRALGVYNPRGLALSAGQVLIADTGGGRILVLDGDARLQAVVGRPGHGDGELADPVDVARDSDGGLVVVDAGNGRIVRFARDGRVEAWPRTSDRMGTEAERLDVAADGTVWMAGGGLREAWSLTPGRAPRRHALPGVEAPDALATAGRRLFLLTPEQVLEVAP
jgi:sugar lactone lactonase YvrE